MTHVRLAQCLVSALLLLLVIPAWAGISAPTQTNFALSQSGASPTLAWTGNTVSGHAVVACAFWKGAVTLNSVTDPQSNTYGDSGAGALARPTDGFLQCYGAANITGGTTPTVTFNFSGAPEAATIDLYLLEYAGVATSSMFGEWATGTATSGTTVTSGTFTPGISDGAVVAFAVGNSADTGAVGTIGGSAATSRIAPAAWSTIVEDRLFTTSLGANITASADFISAVTKAAIIAMTLRAATVPMRTLMGVGL